MPKKYYCYVCKTKLVGKKEFKKHALLHYNGERCPYCNMRTMNLFIHLSFYHIKYKKKMIFHRDLAILCKENGNITILNDPELKLNRFEKYHVKRIMNKL